MFFHDLGPEEIKRISVEASAPIKTAMGVMSENGVRLALVQNPDGTFWGVIGDGDIRRHLLKGQTIDDPVSVAGNASPAILPALLSQKGVKEILDARQVEYLPYLEDGKVSRLFALLPWRAPGKVHAVIMAGGLGTRLRPFTEDCPKPLVEVAGKPILTHSLKRLIAQGVEDFTLCINHLGDMIIDHYGDGSDLGVSIQYIREEKRLGTGGALGLVNHALTDPVLVMNGDIITDLKVSDAINLHQSRKWQATMVTREHIYQVPYGVVETESDGAYGRAREKPLQTYLINTGIYVLDPKTLSRIPKNTFYDLPQLFEVLRDEGVPVGCYRHEGQWIDIGNAAELERANALFDAEVNPT